MVKVEGVSKSYGDIQAIRDINLQIGQGEIFGLIGPDGAGKTTLIRILISMLLPDEGKASLNGVDVVKDYSRIRKMIGYVPGKFALYEDLSIEENMEFFASVYGTTVEKNYHLVKDIYSHIEMFGKRKAGALSGGMKQKLALSCALIHKPKILFLDEPSTGVDPVSRKELWEMLKKLKQEGLTVIVATPYMDEANMCDRVALFHQGNILAVDRPADLPNRFQKPLYSINARQRYRLVEALRKSPHARSVHIFGEGIHYTDHRDLDNLEEVLMDEFSGKGHEALSVKQVQPTIEDIFMDLLK